MYMSRSKAQISRFVCVYRKYGKKLNELYKSQQNVHISDPMVGRK